MSSDRHFVPCRGDPRLVGDPVDVVTGANTDLTVDFKLHGPLPLYWRRYYNSSCSSVLCPLGWGHTHDMDCAIGCDLDGLYYKDPFGNKMAFPALEIGEQTANAGLILHRLSESEYEVIQSGQPVQEFEFNNSSDV